MTYEISARVRQSMCDSLKELMTQKSLDEISIGQVMNALGMCRQHFYYYYTNIYELVEDIFESDEADLFHQQEKADSWQNQLILLLQYAEKNRDVCLCTMNSLGRKHFDSFLKSNVARISTAAVYQMAKEFSPNNDYIESEILTQVLTATMTGIIEEWLCGNLPQSMDELLQVFSTCINDYIRGITFRQCHSVSDTDGSIIKGRENK